MFQSLRAAIPSREEELLRGCKRYLLDQLHLELTLFGSAFSGKSGNTVGACLVSLIYTAAEAVLLNEKKVKTR